MHRRILALAVAVMLCLTGLFGCQRSRPYLSVGISACSQVFSPFFATSDGDLAVTDLLFDNLLTTERGGRIILSGTDGQMFPYDGKEYTYYSPADISVTRSDGSVDVLITLKDNMTFSDGTPITTDDLLFTYYVLCDDSYEGYSEVGSLPIVGLRDYQTQTPVSVYDKYEKIADKIYKKGWPETVGSDLTDQTDWFWNTLRENWQKDVVRTIDYCDRKYRGFSEKYIRFSPAVTAESEGLRTALAMVIWGYARVENGILTTSVSDRQFELKKGFYPSPTTFLEEIFEKYKGDAEAYSTEESAELTNILAETKAQFIRTFGSLDAEAADVDCSTISGIRRIDERRLSITLSYLTDRELYTLLNVYIAPLHYYGDPQAFNLAENRYGFTRGSLEDIRLKDAAPLGSGPYTLVGYEKNAAELTANPSYRRGAPAIGTIRLTEVSEIDRVKDIALNTIDITTVPGRDNIIAEIPTYNIAEKLSGSTVSTAVTAGDTLELIGFNTSLLKIGTDSEASAYLRRAFFELLTSKRGSAVTDALGYRARELTVPLSFDSAFVSIAAQAEGDVSSVTHDVTPVEKALSWLRSAGYTVGDENTVTSAPENGTMQFSAVCLSENTDAPSPAASMLKQFKEQLDSLGLTLTITRLSSADELNAAIKGGKYHLYAQTMSREESLDLTSRFMTKGEQNMQGYTNDTVDELLKDAAEAGDPVNAVKLYKQVVETVMQDNILIPVCQTQNAIIWRTGRFKENSVPDNMTRFWNWTDEVETLRLN